MSTPPASASDDVRRLREALLVADFTVDAIGDRLGTVAAAAMARGERVPALRATRSGDPLDTLVRLFLLGSTEPDARVAAALPLRSAATLGLVTVSGGEVRASLDVRPYAEDGGPPWFCVSDLGTDRRPGPLDADHVLGVGGASLTLAAAAVRPSVTSTLDVGTGCGVQLLHLSRHSVVLTGTDRNPRALRLANLTLGLSDVRAALLEGDLLEPVADRRFDVVVSNPPFVVGPGGRYLYRDGGQAGDDVCRRLLQSLPHVLTPGGWASVLACWVQPRGVPWEERPAGWLTGTGLSARIQRREVQDPAEYAALWLRDSGESDGADYEQAYDRWLDWAEAEDVGSLGYGLITLHADGRQAPLLSVEDAWSAPALPTGPEAFAWFERASWLADRDAAELAATPLRLASGVLLEQRLRPDDEGWRVVGRTLTREDRRAGDVGIVTDEVFAALLAGCDGTRPLRDLLAVLGAAYGVDLDELTAAALPAVAGLVAAGILEPTFPDV